ncbi:hypothetical protein [Endozoicomonas sp. SCSIO W0465]|uniref:hypothetical protein n=1 Tax=Endozoicomonas sp. SCSIO W0465 TaxID=2918516 RepID=UPI0020761253|nr:hypothetical protein [Endozoicomonas sp. SCSIO W0465]USE36610.1 hypothetical protein MJO57_32160 [Endozoicomonas sp. SCSIO W0465]
MTELEVSLPELTSPIAISKAPLASVLSFDTEVLVAAITTFNLNELDEIPRMMPPISVSLPVQKSAITHTDIPLVPMLCVGMHTGACQMQNNLFMPGIMYQVSVRTTPSKTCDT